jgi:hypothetical protein
MMYGYSKVVTSKEMTKGIQCEPDTIALFNKVNFTRHVKNTKRLQDEYLTGEPDIIIPGVMTLDAKTSWSVDTFPVLAADCHDPMYEWQGRAYMRLANVPRHTVFFGLVDTPDELLPRWEQIELHKVSHIDPALRITKITYERDMALEDKMVRKMQLAQKYLQELVTRINAEHNITPDWKKAFVV